MTHIPSLTHPAGQVLTTDNWLAVNVHTASCDLAALLVKPGIDVLKKLNNLKDYWNWPGSLVLSLKSLKKNAAGAYRIRSPYDGQRLTFTEEEITSLIAHLAPDDIDEDSTKYLINNQPAEDALLGKIYTKEGVFAIQEPKEEKNFIKLDETCTCPACKAGFTRAYFHHLYQHTPLLCHRWLVMHNIWAVQQDANLLPSLN